MEMIQISEECDNEARLAEKGKQPDSRSMDQSNLSMPRTPIAVVHRPHQALVVNEWISPQERDRAYGLPWHQNISGYGESGMLIGRQPGGQHYHDDGNDGMYYQTEIMIGRRRIFSQQT
jgi:hypothetical protein